MLENSFLALKTSIRSPRAANFYIISTPYPEETIKVPKQFDDDLDDCSSKGKTEEIEWAKLG